MTRIIWVKGHVIRNDKLAETIEQIPTREVTIIKVQSIEEAICELFEGEGDVAFIICDTVLDASLPAQELMTIAKREAIPFLQVDDDHIYRYARPNSCQLCGGKSQIKTSDKTPTLLSKLASRVTITDVQAGLMGSDATATA